MSDIDDGGTAFPSDNFGKPEQQGMTLRDYFAAAALTALVADYKSEEIGEIVRGELKPRGTAKAAYIIADAMLAARKEGA